MKKLILALLLFAAPLFGATIAVSPTTITTGTRWDNLSGGLYNYIGIPITVSGNSGTVTWTLKDQNGTTIVVLSTGGGKTDAWPTGAANTPPAHDAIFGQIDCTGSSSNTSCTFNAPGEPPPGESATLTASDGVNTPGSIPIVFTFTYNLQEYWKHRARQLGFSTKPYKTLATTSSAVTVYQPELFVFQRDSSGDEAQLLQTDGDPAGPGFPYTAGADINRPFWTYDGKWVYWDSRRCGIAEACEIGNATYWMASTDGSNFFDATPFVPSAPTFTPAFANWYLTSNNTTHYIQAMDLSLYPALSLVNVVSYNPANVTGNGTLSLYSPATDIISSDGPFAEYQSGNDTGGCNPIQPSCAFQVNIYDFHTCISNLVAGCISSTTPYSTWNSNLNLVGFYEDRPSGSPVEHCDNEVTNDPPGGPYTNGTSACEWHKHDFYLQPRSTNTVWNYGPASQASEAIFFHADLNGQNVYQVYPNTTYNIPYMGHPAFDWQGRYVEFSGYSGCNYPFNAGSPPPASVGCNYAAPIQDGEGVWDLQTESIVAFSATGGYGHAAWDGFDDTLAGHDAGPINGSTNPACPTSEHLCLISSLITYGSPGTFTDTQIFDFGVRNADISGNRTYYQDFSPVQSPDATKLAESWRCGNESQANQSCGWIGVVHSPYPPVTLSLSGSSSALLNWNGATLNFESQKYGVYKELSCTGAWMRLAYVSATYRQSTAYSYTDTGLGSGSNACYGISSVEWDNIESSTLSNTIKITNTAGVFTSSAQAGQGVTTGFSITSPGTPQNLSAGLLRIGIPLAIGSITEQTTGGSLTGPGYYFLRAVHCNYSDFPADTVPVCSPYSPTYSVYITDSNTTDQLTIGYTNVNDDTGQSAFQFTLCGPIPTNTDCSATIGYLQPLTYNIPWLPNSHPGEIGGIVFTSVCGSPTCQTLPSGIGANTTQMGYQLQWSAPSDTDVRYYAIYSNDASAPPIASSTLYAMQQYLLATFPATETVTPSGCSSPLCFIDYTPNWQRMYASSGGPYYGIVAVDYSGNFSAPACINAATGATVSCTSGATSNCSLSMTPQLNFGATTVGSTILVTLVNGGQATCTGPNGDNLNADMALTGDFNFTTTCGVSLAAAGSCTITGWPIKREASTTGLMTVPSNDPNSPATLPASAGPVAGNLGSATGNAKHD